jgi:TRAP-type C4-dicarboxylate transport system permease small subunit
MLTRVLDLFDKAFMAVAMAALSVMALSISADALSRYLFNSPITGQYEFTRLYLLVILVFMALSRTYSLGGHVRLRLLERYLRRLPFGLAERLNAALAALVFGALAYVSAGEAVAKFAHGDKLFGAVQFPLYWSYVWVPLGCGLMAARLAAEVALPRVRQDAP